MKRLTQFRTGWQALPAPVRWIGLPLGVIALSAIVWLFLWSFARPRAGYDTLWYNKIGLRYAGVSEARQNAESWLLYTKYAPPTEVRARIEAFAPSGGLENIWHRVCPTEQGAIGCASRRWLGIYEQRPLVPLAIAALRPLFGSQSILAVSFAAVLMFALSVAVGLARLVGEAVAIAMLAVSGLNHFFTPWLIHLATDGWGIALWTAALVAGALFLANSGEPPRIRFTFAALLLIASLALVFTRPLGVALPAAFAAGAGIALLARSAVWRRFALAAGITLLPVVAFAAFVAMNHLPSFFEQLQDLPTRHYRLPDVPNPVATLIALNRQQLPILLAGLLRNPILIVVVGVALAGFWKARQWWMLPFVIGAVIAALIQVLHPEPGQAQRALAPMWVTVHLGIALLLVGAFRGSAADPSRHQPRRRIPELERASADEFRSPVRASARGSG